MSAATELLARTAARRQLHHAIILHGPSHDDLRSLATRLARITLCPGRSGEDGCASCGKVGRGTHPDLHRVEVEDDRKLISVEQLRETVAEATLRPYEGEAKVFILDPADAMSIGAASSLLKTLEEPPSDTFFFLLTRSPDLLLPTIRSRSQAIYAGPEGSAEQSRAALGDLAEEGHRWTGLILDRIAAWAGRGEIAALLELAAELSSIEPPQDAIAVLTRTLRDIAGKLPASSANPAAVEAIRAHIEPAVLLRAATLALDSSRRLSVNVDTRLLFEEILLTLAT
jgi:DNA polymerase III delta prime subunit